MSYVLLGLSHRTASVDIREKLALNESRMRDALELVRQDEDLEEAVILSTCNRVEFYGVARHPARAQAAAWRVLERACGLTQGSQERFRRHLYRFEDAEAINHLFRVASSLDSMVVGEPQILGQLKDAFSDASDAGVVGQFLNRGMAKAFSAAKRVRTETRVAEAGVSVSYVAAQLAQKIFGSLSGKSVLLVGAGEMAELAARNLVAQGATHTTIANRSLDRAQALATKLGGAARPLEALPELLIKADIVITSTGATEPILHRRSLAGIMRARKYRQLFLIDIAVPRDVEPSAGDLDGVYLFTVDDLKEVVAENVAARQKEAQRAERILTEEVQRFMRWVDQTDIVPTVVAMREHVNALKDAELERALAKLSHLSGRDRKVVEQLAHALTNKFLHTPTVRLKRRSAEGTATRELVEVVNDLFELGDPESAARRSSSARPARADSADALPPGLRTAPWSNDA